MADAVTSTRATRYAAWLASQGQTHHDISRAAYAKDALQTSIAGGERVRTYSTIAPETSARLVISREQKIVLLALGLALLANLIFIGIQALTIAVGLVTLIYSGNLVISAILALRTLHLTPLAPPTDDEVVALADVPWPSYTILCPLYQEAEIAPQFVKAMRAMDYPTEQLQILFLTEEEDVTTREAIQAMGLPPHFQVLSVPDGNPRTKPRACNFGLIHATGDYVVIYDAEDVPDPLQLKKAVLTFADQDESLGCVQAKLNFYNPDQNLLTRFFTLEYTLWFDLILPGLQGMGFALPLGGTSNHFRTATLRNLGGWDAFNVTEDCDLGLRLAEEGLRTSVLDSFTMEEANSDVKNWLRQRSRWIKGYFQTYLVHMRNPERFLRVRERGMQFFSLQFLIGGSPATFFINPLMWSQVFLFFLLRQHVEGFFHSVYPAAIFYVAAVCLTFGNFLYLYIHYIACVRREQYRLMAVVPLMPIYWALMCVSAMMAVSQLISKPFYWEKTKHGLHFGYVTVNTPTGEFATVPATLGPKE